MCGRTLIKKGRREEERRGEEEGREGEGRGETRGVVTVR